MLLGSFWFWAAGTDLERSLLGLYRTLLYQILEADDSLCRVAFPEWQTKYCDQDLTLEMLTAAMKVVSANEDSSTRFFFMIDGLDEYEGDNTSKRELANLRKG